MEVSIDFTYLRHPIFLKFMIFFNCNELRDFCHLS
ncbi:hypothetical protein X975_14392, partial [Stegodyphus mimosarum]